MGGLQISIEMEEYAPAWHQMCDRSEKLDELKASVIEYAIQVIHAYNWIGSIDQRGVSRKENMMTSKRREVQA